jgi:hypothetical protein
VTRRRRMIVVVAIRGNNEVMGAVCSAYGVHAAYFVDGEGRGQVSSDYAARDVTFNTCTAGGPEAKCTKHMATSRGEPTAMSIGTTSVYEV